jgi:hypothetical protein
VRRWRYGDDGATGHARGAGGRPRWLQDESFEDTEKIVDALDTHTQGGLKDVLDAVERVEALVKR